MLRAGGNERMTEQDRGTPAQKRRIALGLVAVIAPVVIFYTLLFRQAVNLPEMDDYDAVLHFLNVFRATAGTGHRVAYFVASEHVQYKLWFEHALEVADLLWTGHIDFLLLQQVGNLFVLLTAVVLWRMFHPPGRGLGDRLLLFTPVVFLLFAPRYSETLNWALGSLQNLAVLFFSLLSLWLLSQSRTSSFAWSLVALVLAIASSGNGFFLAAVGFLQLLRQRGRALVWAAVTSVMAALYSYGYVLNRVPAAAGQKYALGVLCLFPVVFAGAAASHLVPAMLLAGAMAVMVWRLWRAGWPTSDEATFSAALFCGMTAVGVALARHNLGLHAALASRYTIYSQLLIALLYMAALNLWADWLLANQRARKLLGVFATATLLFWGWSEWVDMRVLHNRSVLIREHYCRWLNNSAKTTLVPDELPGMKAPGMVEFRQRAERTLVESEKLGVYRPPPEAEVSVKQ